MLVQSLGQEDPLEEGMTTCSSILAWRIPWTEEAGKLPSMGSQSRTRLRETKTTGTDAWRTLRDPYSRAFSKWCLRCDFCLLHCLGQLNFTHAGADGG